MVLSLCDVVSPLRDVVLSLCVVVSPSCDVVECKSVRSKVVSIDRSRFDQRKESVRSKTVTIA